MTLPGRPVRCPCGSGARYEACCGVLHAGRETGLATARTAERLMQSRFVAFAVGDAAYLLATWHRSTRPRTLDLDPELHWRRLQIVRASAGGKDDRDGTVEFVASFWDDHAHEHGEQREHSSFVREGGHWFYVGPVALQRSSAQAPRMA